MLRIGGARPVESGLLVIRKMETMISAKVLISAVRKFAEYQISEFQENKDDPIYGDLGMLAMYLGDASDALTIVDKLIGDEKIDVSEDTVIEALWKMDTLPRENLMGFIVEERSHAVPS